MKLKDVLEKTIIHFKQKNFETSRLDAELIMSKALNISRVEIYLQYDRPLNESELAVARDYVRRRSTGEPIAYILQEKDFYKSTFFVDKRVLIPRPETEQLVDIVLENINKIETPKILDLGCGSGCISLSIVKNDSRSTAVAIDKSELALEVAKINAKKLGVEERAHFIHADAGEVSIDTSFDVIVANPPYISNSDTEVEINVRDFEPAVALFAPENGLQFLTQWSRHWLDRLSPGGFFLMEMGYTQGNAMLEHFKALGLLNIKCLKDYSGKERFIYGEKANSINKINNIEKVNNIENQTR